MSELSEQNKSQKSFESVKKELLIFLGLVNGVVSLQRNSSGLPAEYMAKTIDKINKTKSEYELDKVYKELSGYLSYAIHEQSVKQQFIDTALDCSHRLDKLIDPSLLEKL